MSKDDRGGAPIGVRVEEEDLRVCTQTASRRRVASGRGGRGPESIRATHSPGPDPDPPSSRHSGRSCHSLRQKNTSSLYKRN